MRRVPLVLGALVLAFSVLAPMMFTVVLPMMERLDLREDRPTVIKRCPRDHFVSERDGQTIYVDRNGRECQP